MTRVARKAARIITGEPEVEAEVSEEPVEGPVILAYTEKPEGVSPEAWIIANHWAGNFTAEKVGEMLALAKFSSEMTGQIRECLAAPEGEPEEAGEVEEIEFFAEPVIVLPAGALKLHEEEIGGVAVTLIRRPTTVESPEEAEAWNALQTGSSPVEVAENLGGDAGAWSQLAVLLGDPGIEEVVYPILSLPDVPEGVERDELEAEAWEVWMTTGDEAALEVLAGDGDETDQADAAAMFADIRGWAIRNVEVLPERAEPDLPDDAEPLDEMSLAAWEKLHVEEDPAEAMNILTGGKADPTTLAQAAKRMAELVQILTRTVTFEVTVEEMRQRAGLDKVEKLVETPTTVAAAVTPKITVQQVIGVLGIGEAGGYKDEVIQWAIGQSGAKTPEGVTQWLAAQRPDAVNAVEFPDVKPQRQLKARDFFRTLRSAATKKYPEIAKAAEEERAKATKKTAVEPIRADIQEAVRKGKPEFAVNLVEAALDALTDIGDKRTAAVQVVAEEAEPPAPPPAETESEGGKPDKGEPFLETASAAAEVTEPPADAVQPAAKAGPHHPACPSTATPDDPPHPDCDEIVKNDPTNYQVTVRQWRGGISRDVPISGKKAYGKWQAAGHKK